MSGTVLSNMARLKTSPVTTQPLKPILMPVPATG